MVAVATALDAPIMLVYKSAGVSTLLGLGDVILPGIYMCLSLRFDLWMYYQKKRTYVETELRTKTTDPDTASTVVTTTTQKRAVNADFVSPHGRVGDLVWTGAARSVVSPGLQAFRFPRPYFVASLVGYVAGLLVTLTVLVVFQHGQPALLYLVPAVLASTWGTGYLRGELRAMRTYTEDGSLDTADVVVEVDAEGNVVKESGHGEQPAEPQRDGGDPAAAQPEQAASGNQKRDRKCSRVFLFSVTAPAEGAVEDDEDEWEAFMDRPSGLGTAPKKQQ